jgi:hypothetical protein
MPLTIDMGGERTFVTDHQNTKVRKKYLGNDNEIEVELSVALIDSVVPANSLCRVRSDNTPKSASHWPDPGCR